MRFNDESIKSREMSGDSNQSIDMNDFIVVGSTKMDEYSRLTISKDIKKVFPVSHGDSVIVYQSRLDDNKLLLRMQRFNEVVQTWALTRIG
jgi:hypothetical protein